MVFLAFIPFLISDEYITHLLISGLLFGTLAMGFDFTTGFINVVNFGYAAFWGIGAYASALLAAKLGISPWLGLLAGTGIALAVALLGVVAYVRRAGRDDPPPDDADLQLAGVSVQQVEDGQVAP